jgi:hypothetical protein
MLSRRIRDGWACVYALLYLLLLLLDEDTFLVH